MRKNIQKQDAIERLLERTMRGKRFREEREKKKIDKREKIYRDKMERKN